MSRRRMLPPNVTQFADRHGKPRYRFRKVGCPTYYFQSPLGSPAFMEEYRICIEGVRPAKEERRVVPGTLDDLISRFYGSMAFNRGKEITRQKNRAIIEAFREHVGRDGLRDGARTVKGIEFFHLDKIIAEKAAVHPFAAINLRKQLKRLFSYAVKIKMRADNPAQMTEAPSAKTQGFHTWSEPEIAQYQAHHKLGTKARLALELFLWTAKRRSDGVMLGRQHIQDGCFYGIDDKTGKPSWIPVAPQLQEAIDAMPAHEHLCFLVSERGRPFSAKSFGNRMRKWCDEAGLPQCTTHGLRKAVLRRMAEAGMGNASMKAVSLHSDDKEVAIYTAQANQRLLAEHAMGALSDKHLANPDDGLANQASKNGRKL